jgi:hypothetical protein
MGAISRVIFNRNGRGDLYRVFGGVAALLIFSAITSASDVRAEGPQCEVSERALREASRIRGIQPVSKVPCVVHSRGEVATFLKFLIAEKLPKGALEKEGLVYRALGVVPDDYDYVKGIQRAYTSEIGGYYDPDKKLFVMVDFVSPDLQLPVAIHELTHALQDQKFNIGGFLDPKNGNSDLLLAHSALAEGDATAVMEDYFAKRSGSYQLGDAPSGPPLSGSEPVPAGLREILLFPYKQGLAFVRKIMKAGGYRAVDKAFERPPRSSREILHPEEYVRGVAALAPMLPASLERLGSDWKLTDSNSVGEFVAQAMLRSLNASRSPESCARGLTRDLVGVFVDRQKRTFVSWLSEWDTVGDAVEFVECYRASLRARYKKEISSSLVQVSQTKSVKVSQTNERVSVIVELSDKQPAL